MLFNPTPLEKLTTLTNDMATKYAALKTELKILKEEMASTSAYGSAQDEEIAHLTDALRLKDTELAEKDNEIEAIIAKIESMLG
jgi:chromosome segregation ATPase